MVQAGFLKLAAEEKDGGQRIEVEIEVGADRVDELLDEFYRLMARVRGIDAASGDCSSLSLALADALGEEEVRAASKDFLLNRLTMEAVRELGIDTVLAPGVHAKEVPAFGRAFSFVANLTPRPELSLLDAGPVRVQRPVVAVEESDVDAQVAFSAQQCAEFQSADHADVRVGDFALMDVDMLKNGAPCKSLSGLRRRVEVSEGCVPQGFIDGVCGMTPGEERSFSFDADDGAVGEKPDSYRASVRLYEVQKRVVPVVDDEWVERVLPQFGNLEGFRARIRADLEQQKEKVEQQELVFRVRSALEKRLVGTIPDEMYQEAKESLMASTLSSIDAKGMTLEEYCDEHGTTKDAFNMNVFMQAAETLRQNLALDALARKRGIAETCDEIAEAKAALPQTLATLSDEEFERRGYRASLGESIRRKKALSWLMETMIVEG